MLPMDVVRPDDAAAFLRLAGPLLDLDEARNQLPLAIAATLTDHPDAYDVVRFWVAVGAGLFIVMVVLYFLNASKR